jgi:hypothetical protein
LDLILNIYYRVDGREIFDYNLWYILTIKCLFYIYYLWFQLRSTSAAASFHKSLVLYKNYCRTNSDIYQTNSNKWTNYRQNNFLEYLWWGGWGHARRVSSISHKLYAMDKNNVLGLLRNPLIMSNTPLIITEINYVFRHHHI